MRFFFGLLSFIAAVVVVVLLVVTLWRSFDRNTANSLVSSTYSLDDSSAVDSVARYTITGPVVADENYRETRITVSKTARTIEVLKGYKKEVLTSKTYANTPEAYRAFLGALRAAKFSDVRSGVNDNPSSTCVTGNKYYYELTVGAERKVDTWSSSCATRGGSFAGSIDGTPSLFREQIPDYSDVTRDYGIYLL